VTVHNLALELYHWMQKVAELEKEHAALRPDASLEEHNRLDRELSEAKKAVAHYRKLLEGQKEHPKI
jgi:hypothetical protein